jgi:hypothetical protein
LTVRPGKPPEGVLFWWTTWPSLLFRGSPSFAFKGGYRNGDGRFAAMIQLSTAPPNAKHTGIRRIKDDCGQDTELRLD